MGDSPQLSSDRVHPHGVTLHAPHAPHLIVCYRRTVCLLLIHILPVTTHDRHRIPDNLFTESGLNRFTVRCGFRSGPNLQLRAKSRGGSRSCLRPECKTHKKGKRICPCKTVPRLLQVPPDSGPPFQTPQPTNRPIFQNDQYNATKFLTKSNGRYRYRSTGRTNFVNLDVVYT